VWRFPLRWLLSCALLNRFARILGVEVGSSWQNMHVSPDTGLLVYKEWLVLKDLGR
jgi:hypothetical protein